MIGVVPVVHTSHPSYGRLRSGGLWLKVSSGKKTRVTMLMETNWMWEHIPVIPAMVGSIK
jgi:hypothetical protein